MKAYAAQEQSAPLKEATIERREVGPEDIQMDIAFCGVCHSDLHMVDNDWGISAYPMVPGHEIIGHVTAVGAKVTDYKVGDRVGVGCLVDSCRTCDACQDDLEQFCHNGFTLTYGSPTTDPGGLTWGGYSTAIVVDQHFALHIPVRSLKARAAVATANCTSSEV